MMRAPEFWNHDGALARTLVPASWLWNLAGHLRAVATTPWRAAVPVICVGNLTVGGTGKTPVALAIGARLAARALRVVFLTRGHGGRMAGPVLVDPAIHDADAVGDEPLLLAEQAPTVVAHDRKEGAREAVLNGADAIVMDDGFQNPGIAKDLSLVVVDGETGFGNRRVLPAGPLREPVARGLARAQGAVIVGDDRAGIARALPPGLKALRARLEPENAESLRGARVAAFAGIGRPAKFFATLEALGADLVRRDSFPDHHRYAPAEIAALAAAARAAGARLVTTAKDRARLPAELAAGIEVLRVRAVFDDPAALDALLAGVLDG